MKSEGLGWSRTYFVWGWTSGALSTLTIWQIACMDYATAIFLAVCAGIAFAMAKYSVRPLFGD